MEDHGKFGPKPSRHDKRAISKNRARARDTSQSSRRGGDKNNLQFGLPVSSHQIFATQKYSFRTRKRNVQFVNQMFTFDNQQARKWRFTTKTAKVYKMGYKKILLYIEYELLYYISVISVHPSIYLIEDNQIETVNHTSKSQEISRKHRIIILHTKK